jgi:hypothetical protein
MNPRQYNIPEETQIKTCRYFKSYKVDKMKALLKGETSPPNEVGRLKNETSWKCTKIRQESVGWKMMEKLS